MRRLGVATLLLLVAACSGGDDGGTPIQQVRASASGRTLTFDGACHGELEDLEVRETGDEVHIRASVDAPRTGQECASEFTIRLDRPLGQRRVVDDTTGGEVFVRGVRRAVAVTEVVLAGDDQRVLLVVDSCGRAVRARFVEQSDRVEVAATALEPHEGSCTIREVLRLPHPLDGRELVDTQTGEPIPLVNSS
jgi:hypothetical protein